MIIKIDHIAYSSLDVNADIDYFKNIGYKLDFHEQNLKNLSIKKDFLSNFQETHQLALMTKANSYSLEILNHGSVTSQNGYIKPLNIKNKDFNKVIVNTSSIQKSVDFWKIFGFIPTEMINDMQEMRFSSLLSSNDFYIYLYYNETKKSSLDDKNYNCMAVITSSVQREKQNLDNLGFLTTEIETLKVNNQDLKIFFAQNGNGEIVELIEIKR